MNFYFRIGIYLVVATMMATLVAIGSAYQLTVTERIEQANNEARRQRVIAKLEELVSASENAEVATMSYIMGRSEQDLEKLRQANARCQVEIAYLAEFVADNPVQRERVAALEGAKKTMMELKQQAVRLRQQKDAATALAFISSDAYVQSTRRIGHLVDELRHEERFLAADREQRFAARTRQLAPITAWSALMAIVLALFAAIAIFRQRLERNQTEARLREREKQHQLVTSSVPALIAYVDARQRLQFHNQAIEELLDLPAGHLDGHHIAQLLGARNYNAVLPEIERVLRGQRVEYEGKWTGKRNRRQYLAGSLIPDRDADGRINGFFALLVDITERKLAEKALRASEERWKFALEGAGDGVWDRNIQTGEILYSRRYKEMLGYAEDEIDNRREEWESRVHPEDRARVAAELQDYLEGRSATYASQFRMLRKDGAWIWILSRGMVVSRDAQGRPLRMIGTHADISERIRQQEKIEQINERLDLALRGSQLALWDADLADGRVYLSEQWAQMLGGEPRATLAAPKELLDIVHPEDRARLIDAYVAALKGAGAEYHVEHRVRTCSGAWMWILSRGRVVKRDAAGRALRMTGTNADISARKEVERIKNEFISVVSHELRTPLTSIVGSLGLLARSADMGAETRTLIRVARDNSQRLVRIVNDILEFEKLDSGSLSIQTEMLDLDALVIAAVQANQGFAEQYGVSIPVPGQQGPAWVMANADRLMQVMANLISNAAKFSPRGARIEVRLSRAGASYRVSITDPGPGIPEEFKARIFDRFAQADSSTSRHRGGTGLGLAICKMIIDKLGGRIGFDSAPGRGTTFYFELAAAETLSAATAAGAGGATRAA